MKRLAVIGFPVGHSRSPAMHNAALAALALDGGWTYEALEIAPEELEQRLAELPGEGFAGVNVTIPHKARALELSDEASERARQIGAANTLSFGPSGIAAENTDAPGLLAALGPGPPSGRALVLGAGGSARAVVWALTRAGWRVSVWNRTDERAAELASELGAEHSHGPQPPSMDGPMLLVNATSLGLDPHDGGLASLGFELDSIGPTSMIVDLPYGSQETELARVARERGATVIDGLEILVRQGAESLRIWTGAEAPLEVMRSAARGEEG